MNAMTSSVPVLTGLGLIALVAARSSWATPQVAEVRVEHAQPAVVERAPDLAPGATYTRIHVEILPQSLQDYLLGADEILRGTVLAQQPVFPEIGVPYTEIAFRVDSAVKGEAPGPDQQRVVAVRVAGAWTEERVVDVVGAPRFAVGEEALLFLVRFLDPVTERDYYGIRGLAHGTYRVQPDEEGRPSVRGLLAGGERDLAAFEARLAEARSALDAKEEQR